MTYTIYRRMLLNSRLINTRTEDLDLYLYDKTENDCHLYMDSLPKDAVRVESLRELIAEVPSMLSATTGPCLPVYIKTDNRFVVNYILSNQINASDSLNSDDEASNPVLQYAEKLIAKGRLYIVKGLTIEYSLNNKK